MRAWCEGCAGPARLRQNGIGRGSQYCRLKYFPSQSGGTQPNRKRCMIRCVGLRDALVVTARDAGAEPADLHLHGSPYDRAERWERRSDIVLKRLLHLGPLQGLRRISQRVLSIDGWIYQVPAGGEVRIETVHEGNQTTVEEFNDLKSDSLRRWMAVSQVAPSRRGPPTTARRP
jgi:hypothetical protein